MATKKGRESYFSFLFLYGIVILFHSCLVSIHLSSQSSFSLLLFLCLLEVYKVIQKAYLALKFYYNSYFTFFLVFFSDRAAAGTG